MPSATPTSPAPAPSTAPAPARARGGRVDALDGLRGLALIGMLAWHAEVGWVKGGFARMTIFFVLSGYLATASWVRLQDRGSARPFSTFWRRRVRRLVPITLLGVALATATTAWIGSRDAVADLRGDAASVVFGVSNWRFLFAERSYGELFERPSAFQHFWSLSLEEQLFWVLPVLVAGAVLVAGTRRAWMATAVAAVACAAIPAVWHHSPDAAYYGTHVRAGEFLAGVTLALVLHRVGGEVPERWRPTAQVLGALSLAGLVLVMLTVDRELAWLYSGGLGLFAIPAVAVVAATVAGPGPAGAVLAFAPFRILGRAALSVYALHWPLFQLLDTDRTGLEGPALVLTQLAVGIGVGLVVYRWVEQPLMRTSATHRAPDAEVRPGLATALGRWWSTDRVALPGLAAVAVALVAVAALPTPEAPATGYDLREMERRLSGGTGLDLASAREVLAVTPAVATTPSDALAGDAEVRVGFFGGSTAVSLGAVGRDWTERSDLVELAPGYARLGCGLFTEGRRVHAVTDDGEPALAPPDDYCQGWDVRWPAIASTQELDLAVLMAGVWETANWELDGHDGLVGIDHPELAADLERRVRTAVALFHRRGAAVALVTTPEVGVGTSGEVHERRMIGPEHPVRVAVYNDILRRVAADTPDVSLIEYGVVVDLLDPATEVAWLPDGIHPTEAAAATIWRTFLGPALEDVVRSGRVPEAGPPSPGPGAPSAPGGAGTPSAGAGQGPTGQGSIVPAATVPAADASGPVLSPS